MAGADSRSKTWPHAGGATRLMLGGLGLGMFVLVFARLTRSSPEVLPANQRLLLGTLLVLHLPDLLRSARFYLFLRSANPRELRLPRPTLDSIVVAWSYLGPLFLLLGCTWLGRWWTLADVGWNLTVEPGWAVLAGVASAYVFQTMLARVQRLWAPRMTATDSFGVSVLRAHLHRGRLARYLAGFQTIVLAPVLEELVYRGFFVHFSGQVLGGIVNGLSWGLLLCLWLHVYQGPSRVLSMSAFFGATVCLLHSPCGLLAAIAFHSTLNVRFQFALAWNAKWYLEHFRARRAACLNLPGDGDA